MLSQLITAYAEARRAHMMMCQQFVMVEQQLRGSRDMKELADAVHALKQISDLANDIKKEANRRKEFFERLCCAVWMNGDGSPIKTEYCTGSPEVKQTVATPKSDTPEYADFCKHFGVDPSLPFRPHWPTMLDRISDDLAQGKPLPPGCDPSTVWTVFRVATRRIKPIDGDTVEDPELLRATYELFDQMNGINFEALRALTDACQRYEELCYTQAERDEAPITDESEVF